MPSRTSTPETNSSQAGAGTYGFFVPRESAAHDPSRGAELERDVMPPDADFSQPPTAPDPAASREDRIRDAAYARYRQRQGTDGGDVDDWLAAEADIDREEREAPSAAPDPQPPTRRNSPG